MSHPKLSSASAASIFLHVDLINQKRTIIRRYFTLPRYRHSLLSSKGLRHQRKTTVAQGVNVRKEKVSRATFISLSVNYQAMNEGVAVCTKFQHTPNVSSQPDCLRKVITDRCINVQLARPQLDLLLNLLVTFNCENSKHSHFTAQSKSVLDVLQNFSTQSPDLSLKYSSGLQRRNAIRQNPAILEANTGERFRRTSSLKSTEWKLDSSVGDESVARSLSSYLGHTSVGKSKWRQSWSVMSPEEATMREALYEIVHTEEIFLKNIKAILDKFVPHSREKVNYTYHRLNRRLTPCQYAHLWANLRDIYRLHRCLYRKMLLSLDRQLLTSLGAILDRFFGQASFSAHYRAYIVNQPEQQKVLSTEAARPYRHLLDSVLIMPVQRVMRYKLMLENVLRAGEKCPTPTVDIKETLRHARTANQTIKEMLELSNRQAKQMGAIPGIR